MKYRIVEDLLSKYHCLRYRVQEKSSWFGWCDISTLTDIEQAYRLFEAKINGSRYEVIKEGESA